MLKVFEAFAGYGSQSLALERLGIPHQVVAISEIDKYALQAYYSLHDSSIPNLGDISKIDVKDIPDHDLFTYSFPCQDISVAGRTRGIVAGETISGLLYECEKIIEGKKPKYLLMENVKNLVGKKFKADFDRWLDYLEGLGYTNYWKVLNAKHYGVPQNRERVFVVSILGEHEPYVFPDPVELTIRVKDLLDNDVPEKYYLKQEIQDRFLPFPKDRLKGDDLEVLGTTAPNPYDKDGNIIYDKSTSAWVYNVDKLMSTLSARDYKQPKQIAEPQLEMVGMLDMKGNECIRRVYSPEGLCPTITTMQGGNTQPKVICRKIEQTVRVRKYEVDTEGLKAALKEGKKNAGLSIREIAEKLGVKKTTVEHWFRSDNCFSIPEEDVWMDLKALLGITTDVFDKSIMEFECKPNEFDMSNRVYEVEGLAPTLTASGGENGAPKIVCEQRCDEGLRFFKDGVCGTIRTINSGGDKRVIEKPFKIRKLTPKECFRLMGLNDTDIEKIQATGLSDTQQYKMAGNSIVVDVLEAMFKNLF